MAPAYRSQTVISGTFSQPQSINVPAGVVNGDLLLVFAGCVDATKYWTVPAGWTVLSGTGLNASGAIDDGADSIGQVWYRVASSEPTSYSFDSPTWAQTGVLAMVAYSGVDTTTPIHVAAARAWTTGTTAATPTITPTVNGCLLVGFFSSDESVASSWTPPSGMTERIDAQESGFFEVIEVCDVIQTTAAAVTKSATLATSDTGTAFLIALTPGSSAVTNTRTVPASAALQATLTRTVPASAALQGTSVRTVPASAALSGAPVRTVLASAALRATLGRTVPTSAALSFVLVRTVPTSAALLATNARTVPASAVLLRDLYPPNSASNGLTNTTPPSAGSRPAYLTPRTAVAYTGAAYNTKTTRVSDHTAFSISSATEPYLRHHYSKQLAWNADETLIALTYATNDGISSIWFLNATTYALTYTRTTSLWHPSWHPTDARYMYGIDISNGTSFVRYNPVADTSTTLYTIPGTYNRLDFGEGEGIPSSDGRYWALSARKTTGGAIDCLVFDTQSNTVVSTFQVATVLTDLDWVAMSPSGTYVIVKYIRSVTGTGTASNQGVWRYNRDGTGALQITTYATHGTPALDADGSDVYVQVDSSNRGMKYLIAGLTAPDTGATVIQTSTFAGGWFSAANINRPGWIYASTDDSAPAQKGYQEAFALKMDGTGVVERFGYTFSTDATYEFQPHGTVNHDGTKILFASNWQVADTLSHAYIVELASASLTRTVPASAALSLAGNVRTVPTSAALLASLSRTVPTSAALKATLSRTVPTSAALLATLTRTVPASAALSQANNLRTVPTSAALLATLSRTVPSSAALQATLVRTVPASTALLGTTVRTVPASANLAGALVRVVPTSAALSRANNLRTVSTSAVLLSTTVRTVPTSAALAATRTRTVATSGALSGTLTRTVPTSAALSLAGILRTVPASTALRATLTRTVPTSAALSLTTTRSVGSAAVLVGTTTRTVVLSAALQATLGRTVPSSTALVATLGRTVPVSAFLADTVPDYPAVLAIGDRASTTYTTGHRGRVVMTASDRSRSSYTVSDRSTP